MRNIAMWLLAASACLCVPGIADARADKAASATDLAPQVWMKLHDNGDGTYSWSMYTQGSAGSVPATPTLTSVSVSANTSTQVIAASTTRKGLAIISPVGNTTCTMNPAGGTASATSAPIPGGWNWEESSPPPATAVTVFCTTAGAIAVVEMN